MATGQKKTTPTGSPREGRGDNPLIVTQRPSKASLLHQDSFDSSDEDEDWEDASAPPVSSLPSHPTSPHPASPTRSTSHPAGVLHSLVSATFSVPEKVAEVPEKKKEKSKKRRFLFRRKKKGGGSEGSLQTPGKGAGDMWGSYESDSGGSLKDLADILEDPSLVQGGVAPGGGRLSLPEASMKRSISDSAVHKAGLELEMGNGEGGEEGRGERGQGEVKHDWLIRITLESGHGLAIRDRTGTSDPYVKFKCGQFKYRSTVVHRNLNPEWNEAFSFITDNTHIPLQVKVYDHDYGSLDDFMGGGTISLESYTRGELHIVDIGLRDPSARETSLGFLRLFLSITAHTEEEEEEEEPEQRESAVSQSIQEWNSVLTIHLLEGTDLPAMDDNGFSDPYCKFKLGRQKRKSKVVNRSLNPHWKEQFDMRLYHGDCTTLHVEVWDRDILHSDDFIGETSMKLDTLTQEQTHDLTLPLARGYSRDSGTVHLLLTITGTAVREVKGDTPTSTPLPWRPRSATEIRKLMNRYVLSRSLSYNLWYDVGHLTITIDRVEGLGRPADLFAIAELGNSQARTHTIYRTSAPFWGKTFYFDIKDIHSPLEVSVYSAKSKPELIGRIKIPLLRLHAGLNMGYVLKDKYYIERAQGVLYLKCELVYQPVRAGLRTFNPRENKLMEKDATFQRKVLMHNIKRISALVQDLSAGMVWIRDIYNWKSKLHSTLALLGFIVGCLVVELWMVPLLLLLVFLAQYGVVYGKGRHHWQLQAKHRANSMDSISGEPPEQVEEEWSDLEDDLEAASSGGGGKKNIRDKFRQIQGILLIVQNVLGDIADMGERVNNLLGWKVPFLCWLAIILLSVITVVMFLVPLRYIILIWGVNKLTKKLRKPNHIPHTELLDFLSCSPSNRDLLQYRSLPLNPPAPGHAKPHQSRSPVKSKSKPKQTHRSRSPQPRSPQPRKRSSPLLKHRPPTAAT